MRKDVLTKQIESQNQLGISHYSLDFEQTYVQQMD